MKSRIKTAVYNLSNSFGELLMRCDFVCIAGLMMFMGAMLFVGEWLCVNVAWKCMDYNQVVMGVSFALISSGLISLFMGLGIKYEKSE
jgi:hypothetical protein